MPVTWPRFDPTNDSTIPSPGLLPSRQTTPNMGFGIVSGEPNGMPSSGFDWGKAAFGAASFLPALFAGSGGSKKIDSAISEVQNNARTSKDQGAALAASGAADLNPVLKYFKDLVSGNPTDVLNATTPQRRRVIDQYDTARNSAAQFTPRGGGTASTQQESRAREAGDIASLTADTRSNAATALGGLAENERNAGLTSEQAAQQALASALGPLMQQQQANQAGLMDTFKGLASFIAPLIFGV